VMQGQEGGVPLDRLHQQSLVPVPTKVNYFIYI
jgi:hypothetical protein